MSLITLLTAEPKKGKSWAALDLVQGSRAVFFVPAVKNNNPRIAAIPWVMLADLNAHALEKIRQNVSLIRIVTDDAHADVLPLFMTDAWNGWVFVFDDFPQLFLFQKAKNYFSMFAAGIRHRDCALIVTTQRILGQIPKFVQVNADAIYQVGPLVDMEEARHLHSMGGGARYPRFKDYYQAISTNPSHTLFTIKNTA